MFSVCTAARLSADGKEANILGWLPLLFESCAGILAVIAITQTGDETELMLTRLAGGKKQEIPGMNPENHHIRERPLKPVTNALHAA